MDIEQSNLKVCDICKENATYICFTCKNYLCEKCSKYIHDMKINSAHKKEKLDPYIPIELKCQDHPEHPIFLFCLDEKGML